VSEAEGNDLTLVIGNRNYSSWSMRPWILLRHFDVEFEELRIPLDTPTFAADIAPHSPTGRVPVLKAGDQTIWDSLAIVEYVADALCEQAWPQARAARALARSVSAEMHSGFESLRANLPMNVRGRGRPASLTDKTLADIRRIEAIWLSCLDDSGGPFLFGDFTAADAMYAPVVSRFVTYGIQASPQAYVAEVAGLAAYREWALLAAAELESHPATDALVEALH
jgi:glutathione S-transferase